MEEKKKINWRRVAWRTINVIGALLIMIGIFALSVPAGICSLIFSTVGFVFGWFEHNHKMQEKFFDTLLEGKEDFFSGKTVTVTADDETGTVSFTVTSTAVEDKEEKPTKKKKVQED